MLFQSHCSSFPTHLTHIYFFSIKKQGVARCSKAFYDVQPQGRAFKRGAECSKGGARYLYRGVGCLKMAIFIFHPAKVTSSIILPLSFSMYIDKEFISGNHSKDCSKDFYMNLMKNNSKKKAEFSFEKRRAKKWLFWP